MGILLCEQNFRNVWIRNQGVRAEIGQLLRTHTHTHAAKLVVRVYYIRTTSCSHLLSGVMPSLQA